MEKVNVRCLICGIEDERLLCRSCESEENLEGILMELVNYSSCETDNELLKEHVLSFNNWSEVGDEILRLCCQYSDTGMDLNYYISCAYYRKGKDYRSEFIKYALRYLDNPIKSKDQTIFLLRDLSKAYAAEYEFYKAIDICDLLLRPEYEYLNANLLKAENLVKIRKTEEAIELLESAYEELREITRDKELTNEDEKMRRTELLCRYEKAIYEYKDKQNKGYIYIPATVEGKNKLKELFEREGRYTENQTIIEQTEANFNSFVCFDFETTGFASYDKITEIGAVKVVEGEIVEVFSELVNPNRRIPEIVTEKTGITNDMVKDKDGIHKVLPKFLKFVGDNILVAHNAKFDCRFLFREAERIGRKIKNPVLDTMALARRKLPRMTSYKLTDLTEQFEIEQKEAHRAYCDAEATAKLYFRLRSL